MTARRLTRSELPRIGVAEAAAILLVIERAEPEKYERTALRWLAKLATESREVDLAGLAQAAMHTGPSTDTPGNCRFPRYPAARVPWRRDGRRGKRHRNRGINRPNAPHGGVAARRISNEVVRAARAEGSRPERDDFAPTVHENHGS
jgi:hypothetical protein